MVSSLSCWKTSTNSAGERNPAMLSAQTQLHRPTRQPTRQGSRVRETSVRSNWPEGAEELTQKLWGETLAEKPGRRAKPPNAGIRKYSWKQLGETGRTQKRCEEERAKLGKTGRGKRGGQNPQKLLRKLDKTGQTNLARLCKNSENWAEQLGNTR